MTNDPVTPGLEPTDWQEVAGFLRTATPEEIKARLAQDQPWLFAEEPEPRVEEAVTLEAVMQDVARYRAFASMDKADAHWLAIRETLAPVFADALKYRALTAAAEEELDALAERAVESLASREGEDVEEWADHLIRSLPEYAAGGSGAGEWRKKGPALTHQTLRASAVQDATLLTGWGAFVLPEPFVDLILVQAAAAKLVNGATEGMAILNKEIREQRERVQELEADVAQYQAREVWASESGAAHDNVVHVSQDKLEAQATETARLWRALEELHKPKNHDTFEDWCASSWPHGYVPPDRGKGYGWREPIEWCKYCQLLEARAALSSRPTDD